jgi:hypothetical protein
MPMGDRKHELDRYRGWFWAAAAYNAVFGALATLWPNAIFDWLNIARPNYPPLFQAIGMMVGVYAIGYALIAINPERYGPFVWVGLLGKACGPIGLAFAARTGQLPWRFGWVNVMNDLIWLPAFLLFAWEVIKFERHRS